MKAVLVQKGQMVFLYFFNSKEVYSLKGFETERKARIYAKKYGYTLFETLPEGVAEYQYCN
jgi:hypothetical protein